MNSNTTLHLNGSYVMGDHIKIHVPTLCQRGHMIIIFLITIKFADQLITSEILQGLSTNFK